MDNMTYENQGANTFLVYALSDGEDLDTTGVGMITNNRIPGLLSAVFTQTDSRRFIKYNVTAKVPVSQMLVGMVNKRRIMGLLNGIAGAFLSADEFMIDPRTVVLDTDYMFSDVTTCETYMICVPTVDESRTYPDIPGFIKQIMFTSRFDESENNDYVARIINYLNSASSAFSLYRFSEILGEISSAPPRQPAGCQPIPVLGRQTGESTASPVLRQDAPPQRPFPADQISNMPSQSIQDLPRQAVPQMPPRPQNAQRPAVDQGLGFAVPGRDGLDGSIPRLDGNGGASAAAGEKQISLFYLLQHYNKENAALYKAQKERSKAAAPQKKPPAKKQKHGKRQKGMPQFQVPGQDVPGQDMQNTSGHSPSQDMPTAPQMHGAQQFQPAPRQFQQQSGYEANFGDTVYIGSNDSDTVIMGLENSSQQLRPQLIRKSNGERIPIDKEYFRIGRDVDYNDYAVVNNKHVGHSHCHIFTKDGEYFVVDDNSKNRTLVNGTAIPSGQNIKLAHGYVVTLADEAFEFRLY